MVKMRFYYSEILMRTSEAELWFLKGLRKIKGLSLFVD